MSDIEVFGAFVLTIGVVIVCLLTWIGCCLNNSRDRRPKRERIAEATKIAKSFCKTDLVVVDTTPCTVHLILDVRRANDRNPLHGKTLHFYKGCEHFDLLTKLKPGQVIQFTMRAGKVKLITAGLGYIEETSFIYLEMIDNHSADLLDGASMLLA